MRLKLPWPQRMLSKDDGDQRGGGRRPSHAVLGSGRGPIEIVDKERGCDAEHLHIPPPLRGLTSSEDECAMPYHKPCARQTD